MREKHPGQHAFDCRCSRCQVPLAQRRCWDCGALQVDPPSPLPNHHHNNAATRPIRRRRHHNHHLGGPENRARNESRGNDNNRPKDDVEGRIQGEDLRTWLMAYRLNINVYICAERFLMDGMKKNVARHTVDMLETAGTDAAQPEVLQLCAELHAKVPETDPLLKMILPRVGFLQPILWKNSPMETSEFLINNPEVGARMLRETVLRHELDTEKKGLPPMETEGLERRNAMTPPPPPPRRRRHGPIHRHI